MLHQHQNTSIKLFAMEIIYTIRTTVQKLVATKTVSQTSEYTQKKIEV